MSGTLASLVPIYRLIYELNHEGHDEIESEQLDIPFSELPLQATKFLRPEHSREFGKQVGLQIPPYVYGIPNPGKKPTGAT